MLHFIQGLRCNTTVEHHLTINVLFSGKRSHDNFLADSKRSNQANRIRNLNRGRYVRFNDVVRIIKQ